MTMGGWLPNAVRVFRQWQTFQIRSFADENNLKTFLVWLFCWVNNQMKRPKSLNQQKSFSQEEDSCRELRSGGELLGWFLNLGSYPAANANLRLEIAFKWYWWVRNCTLSVENGQHIGARRTGLVVRPFADADPGTWLLRKMSRVTDSRGREKF